MEEFINTAIRKKWHNPIKNNCQRFSLFTKMSSFFKCEKSYSKSLFFYHRNDSLQWHPKNKSTKLSNLLSSSYY